MEILKFFICGDFSPAKRTLRVHTPASFADRHLLGTTEGSACGIGIKEAEELHCLT